MISTSRCVGALLAMLSLFAVGCSNHQTGAVVAEGTTTGAGMEIGFTSVVPPKPGDNTFDVMVRKDGVAVENATVTAVFSMPAMPSMNMPEMRSAATLPSAGGGHYRGTGQLAMAGTWNVHVRVTRDGQVLGSKSLSILAK